MNFAKIELKKVLVLTTKFLPEQNKAEIPCPSKLEHAHGFFKRTFPKSQENWKSEVKLYFYFRSPSQNFYLEAIRNKAIIMGYNITAGPWFFKKAFPNSRENWKWQNNILLFCPPPKMSIW